MWNHPFVKSAWVTRLVYQTNSLRPVLLSTFKFTSTVVATDSLYEEFKRSLQINIQKSNERYLHTQALDSTDHIPRDAVSEYISDGGIDPLLRANFQIMFNNVYQRMKTNKEQTNIKK